MTKPLRIEVAGKVLRCVQCEAEVFFRETVTLDRLILGGLFHTEGWSGRHATIYVCGQCGYMHFYVVSSDYDRHQLTETAPPSERVQCLSCGAAIASEDASCSACGWTWAEEGPHDDVGGSM